MERSNYWNDWKCYLSVQLWFDCRYVYCFSIVICFYLLKSEVSIGSLFFQIQLSLSNLTVYIKKGSFKALKIVSKARQHPKFNLKTVSSKRIRHHTKALVWCCIHFYKTEFRPTECIQANVCNQIINKKTNQKILFCWIFWSTRNKCYCL